MADGTVLPFDYMAQLDRRNRAAAAEPETDPLSQTIAGVRADIARQTILDNPNPDKIARVTSLARQSGDSTMDVEGREDTVQTALNARRFGDLAQQHPVLGQWAADNPRGAAAASDDHQSLGILGTAWDFLKNAPGRIVGTGGSMLLQGGTNLFNTLEEGKEALLSPLYAGMSAVAQATGAKELDPTAPLALDAARRQRTSDYFANLVDTTRAANKGQNRWSEGLLQGLDSIGMTAAAVATRNPEMASGIIGSLTGANAYSDAKNKGLSTPDAISYAIQQGGTEALTEKIPAGTLVDMITRKTPWGKGFLRELGQEMTGEQVSTLIQDMSDWAYLPENKNKTLKDFVAERPAAALDTALAVASGTVITTGAIEAAHRAVDTTAKIVDRIADVRQAQADRTFLDQAAKGVEASKLKQRDPEAFRSLIRQQAADAGSSDVFIPGEAIQAFRQSEGYEADTDPFGAAGDEADATGGDLVMPIEDFLTDVVGSKAYDAVKDDVRLTQGGMSSREAQEFQDSIDEVMGKLSDEAAAREKADATEKSVREKLVDEVAAKFGDSFTSPVARQYAELAVQRAQTRASRLGQDLQGNEFDNFDVRQVMPESLAQAVQADRLDLIINAMRKGGDAEYGVGPSLLDFIKQRGGVNDTGGDLASMGVPKRYLRDFDPRQGSFGGVSGEGDFGLDNTLQAAISAGYFPDLAGVENEAGPSHIDTQTLLDAIGDEIGGKPRYAETRTDDVRASAQDLSDWLGEAGYSPSEMTDAEVRAAVEKLAQHGSEGGYEQDARGRIIFDQNKRTIELFQSRNLSTPIHEFGHMWLEELRFDASMPDAPEQLKADWQWVQTWFSRSGHAIDENGNIPVEAHELFARGTEAYIMEGKAPSATLTRLFENFRQWLVSIYKTVAGLKAPISPEMREVFDRMLATDDEIDAARERQGIATLFKDAASLGMSEPEFQAYQRQADEARADSHAALLDKTMRAIRRRETERFREARKGVKAEQTERIDASPVYKALRMLKDQRVNREWIVDRMGLDALDMLPKRVPPVFVDGGVNPDAVAEMAGYSSGATMIEALIGAERAHRQAKEGGDLRSMRERAIETATDEEMNRRYGDPLNDGSIEREALAAVQSDMQGEVIASEIRVLARKTGKRPTPYRIARDWAREKVRSGTVADEASPGAIQRHARNAAKAARAAEAAMLKGDAEETYRQKQYQMINGALLTEAKAAADEVQSAVSRMQKVADARTRKSVDQDYLEQAQALLASVDIGRRTQKSIERQAKWEEWASAREAEGYDMVAPPSFAATINRTHYSKLPVESLLTLDETVKQVMHLGRLKQTLLDNQEEREWGDIFGEAEVAGGNIDGPPPADLAEPGWWDAVKRGASGIDASLLKMETVFDWLDGGNSNGVFNRVAFRPIADAQAQAQTMLKDYYGRIKGLFEAVPGEVAQRWQDKLTPPFTDPHTGGPMRINRHQAIAMALNIGNEGNLQRLADGYSVNPAALEGWLNDTLAPEEWQFVQGVWDTIDTLWPQIEGLERRVNGIAPEKIAPRSFATPHGQMKGGYYPAIYDSTRDYRAEENRGKESDLFEGRYTRATTRASSTKERSEKVSRPILLDLGVINRHLGEVIHDITHREAVIKANRFLSSERVRRTVDSALGPEIGKQLRPWLKFVANSWAMERAGNEGFGKWLGKLRSNVTAVGMGLRATTMVTQIAGYSNSAEFVGGAAMSKAIARFSAHPIAMTQFVMERSGEVRARVDTMDRDIRTEIARISATNPASKAAGMVLDGRKFFFHGIGYMDRIVAVPTWLAGYNNALEQGMSEADAAYAGDKAVRMSQGSGAPKDLAAIQRGTGKWGEALKLLTMFYSYFSAQYQRQRSLGRDVAGIDDRRPRNMPKLAARAMFLLVLPPLLTEVLRAAAGANAGPDDDEWWAQWTARKLLANAIGPIPVARELFEPAWQAAIGHKYFAPAISPLQRSLDAFITPFADIGKATQGKEVKHGTKDVLDAVGYATGLVPGQLSSATQFLVDVGEGDADPEGFGDWLTGLSTGKLPED